MNDSRHNDYMALLVFIAIWLMISAMAQCSTAEKLDEIVHELRMMN
ncbi:MAG: hypothetical protein J6S67_00250 [Methanobrevibacter sp.]|nr:hypothetical protein [Methanobrevibacter sp.]